MITEQHIRAALIEAIAKAAKVWFCSAGNCEAALASAVQDLMHHDASVVAQGVTPAVETDAAVKI